MTRSPTQIQIDTVVGRTTPKVNNERRPH